MYIILYMMREKKLRMQNMTKNKCGMLDIFMLFSYLFVS